MRPDYSGARSAAVALLLKQRLYRLPVDVTRLKYDKDIKIDSIQNFCLLSGTNPADIQTECDCLRDGCTLIRNVRGKTLYIVLYNEETQSLGRRGFTLAHEIGHIMLGHTEDGDKQEKEANCFAAQLLAPDVLVHALHKRKTGNVCASDLASVFALSNQAAKHCLTRLAKVDNSLFSHEDLALLKKTERLLPDDSSPVVDI